MASSTGWFITRHRVEMLPELHAKETGDGAIELLAGDLCVLSRERAAAPFSHPFLCSAACLRFAPDGSRESRGIRGWRSQALSFFSIFLFTRVHIKGKITRLQFSRDAIVMKFDIRVLVGIGLLALTPCLSRAQTKVDLRAQAKNIDFSAASSTTPFQSGMNLPGVCSLGQVFFKTNAPPGANFYACTSANTWTLEGDIVSGSGTIVSHSPLSVAVDTSYLNTLYPQLAVSNIFTAGSRQTFTPSSTTEGIRIVCGTVPSTISSGGLFCTPAGILGYYDGSTQKYPVVSTTTTVAPNLVFAGPSSGSAAPPGPRVLVSADLPAANTRRTCSIVVGSDNGSALANADLGPRGRQCFIPAASTAVEVTIAADAGTPSVIVRRNVAGTGANLTSAALATATSGGIACSKTSAVTGIDGATTCTATLQNTALAPGSWIELISGTAGGTAKRMSINVTYTVD